ncbi:MAG: C69 family dipeptidase [Synergistaceae bacterium]|nr:C69 family dipeptidase [Synergistaceae bacterium]
MQALNKRWIRSITAIITLWIFLLSPAVSWACSGIAIGKNASANGNAIFCRTDDYDPHAAQIYVVRPAGYIKAGETWIDPFEGFGHKYRHDSYKYITGCDMEHVAYAHLAGAGSRIGRFKFKDEHGINEKGFSVTGTHTHSPKSQILAVDPAMPSVWYSGFPSSSTPAVAGNGGWQECNIGFILGTECDSVEDALTLTAQIMEEKGAFEFGTVSMGDKTGVWVLELLSGHQWVASRVPDDKFVAIANLQVHGAIDINDKANYRASKEIYTTLEKVEANYQAQPGYTPASGDIVTVYVDTATNKVVPKGTTGAKVHISASYSNPTSTGSTYRRWWMHQVFTPSLNIPPIDRGNTRWPEDPRPNYEMYVKPDKLISVLDVMLVIGDRAKNAPPVDFSAISGVAGRAVVDVDSSRASNSYNAQGRESDSRGSAITTFGANSSTSCHIYEVPGNYPPEIGGRGWVTMGPAEFALWLPTYGLATDTHPYFKKETVDFNSNTHTYDSESAYWIFHDLSEQCRKNREHFGWPVREFWTEYVKKLINEQTEVEEKMLELYAKKPETAKKFITEYLMKTHDEAFKAAKVIREALLKFQADPGRNPTDVFAVPNISFVSVLDSIVIVDDDDCCLNGCNGVAASASYMFCALILAAALWFRRKG